MLTNKIAFGSATAVAALLLSSAMAAAAPAVAESNVNVRAGPGTNYPVVDRMSTGERVNVDRCIPGFRWCHVQRNGADGWVAATTLRDFQQRPFERYAFSFNIPQLGFTIGLGQGGIEIRPGQPPQPPQVARVCFYEHANYEGSSFCATEGQSNARLGQTWNDKISSIRVEGGAQVRVCENWDYQGSCQVYRGNVAFVGAANDTISSYQFGRGGPGQPPQQLARVCFYEDANFQGSSFCALGGQANARLPQNWNDKISSIRIEGGAQVRVCEHWDYQGSCQVYRGNIPFVGGSNDTISSYRVT